MEPRKGGRHWLTESLGTEVDFTFAYLNNGAAFFLQHAEKSTAGGLYNCLAVLAFSAFCLEAYLNEMGSRMFRHWRLLERSLSTATKLTLITDQIGVSPDRSSRPFQSLHELHLVRNFIAHPKPGEFRRLSSFCTLEHATRLKQDMRDMVLQIHQSAGYSDDPFLLLSSTAWEARE
jgi:hypothetical protein